VDGAVEYTSGGWVATGAEWTYDAERYERIAAARRAEADAMLAYERGASCRMAFLTEPLDHPHSAPCGRCDVCAEAWYPRDVAAEQQESAQSTLDRGGVPLAPRARWPSGLDQRGVRSDGKPVKG